MRLQRGNPAPSRYTEAVRYWPPQGFGGQQPSTTSDQVRPWSVENSRRTSGSLVSSRCAAWSQLMASSNWTTDDARTCSALVITYRLAPSFASVLNLRRQLATITVFICLIIQLNIYYIIIIQAPAGCYTPVSICYILCILFYSGFTRCGSWWSALR